MSTDNTVNICKKYTKKVFIEEWKGYANQKNSAIEKTKHDWIFWIDSDEELTPEGQRLLFRINKGEKGAVPCVGYEIKRRTMFLGRWMDHCWGNDYALRLFKKGKDVYFPDAAVHEKLHINGNIGKLQENIINHYPYETIKEYLDKFINYANLAAEERRKQNKKISKLRIVFSPLARFIKLYILKFGFLDGWAGFVLSALCAFHDFVKYLILWHTDDYGTRMTRMTRIYTDLKKL